MIVTLIYCTVQLFTHSVSLSTGSFISKGLQLLKKCMDLFGSTVHCTVYSTRRTSRVNPGSGSDTKEENHVLSRRRWGVLRSDPEWYFKVGSGMVFEGRIRNGI